MATKLWAEGEVRATDFMGEPRHITDLDELVAALPTAERELFEGIFQISTSTGRLNAPAAMHDWIEGYFGSIEAVSEQRIVRITNLITMDGAFFNELRSKRPVVTEKPEELEELIAEDLGGPFCRPLEGTPEDVFGRIRGRHSTTASNVAKFDGWSGVVVFDEHDPLTFTRDRIADYIETGLAWAHRAHEVDEEAKYPFFLWNCLWRAGASIVHGHAQMILGRDMHYAKVEHLRRAALGYRGATGRDYFDDLYRVHASLGLAVEMDGTRVMAYLAPVKEKEALLIADVVDDDLKNAIYRVLDCYVRGLGVSSFNVVICMPPIGPVEEDWSGFPVIARVLDRGDPMNRTVDMAAMELYASSVVSSDPFRVVDALRNWMEE